MSDLSDQIVIRKLNNKEEMLLAFDIVKQRYNHLDLEKYNQQLSEMISMNDFKMVAAFLGDKIVGVAGYWILRMLYCGKYIQVSSFIVNEESRGFGIGKKILAEVEKIGKDLSCEKIVLDSYTENKKSHSLYYRSGFHIRGFHFMKDI
ncbi:MAG: GNAT family N-acetyltransferase [Pelagibacterales bacterium]|nr:GNAT family N-acetyltransferase [Pelagibacterales bacterium]